MDSPAGSLHSLPEGAFEDSDDGEVDSSIKLEELSSEEESTFSLKCWVSCYV